jgi:hypothetical protein
MSVTEDWVVRALVLACGTAAAPLTEADDVRVLRVGERPGKDEIDPLLAAYPGAALVVAGSDADLAAVVLRLLRKERLALTPVGFVPVDRASAVARQWGLSGDPERALDGEVVAVPLVRDDAGGVLVGRGTFHSVNGVAYCDDQVALRGSARSIEVRPDPSAGLLARVRTGRFSRPVTFTARAFQLGCLPSRPTCDGVPHPREVKRWTWYRHTEDLWLVR